MRIDPHTGGSVNVDAVVEPSQGGFYGWWGTHFSMVSGWSGVSVGTG